MAEITAVLDNRTRIMRRLILLIAGAAGLLLVFNKASIFIILALIFIILSLLIFREKIWVWLIVAAPTLALGAVINIPVTTGWVYEARIAEIVLGTAAAVYALYVYLNGKTDSVKADKLVALLGVYLLFSLASFAYIVDLRNYVFGMKIIIFGFLAYFLALNLLDTPKKVRYFLGSLAATAAILSVQLFFKFYEIGFSTRFFFERNSIMIPIGPVATTSAIIALLAPVVLGFYLAEAKQSKTRPFIFVAFALSFVAVFLTLGKAAIGSLGIGLFIIFLRTKNKVPQVLFIAWFLLAAYLLFNPFMAGLYERIKTTLVDANTQFRIEEMKTSWEVFKDHPILGVGAGQQLWYFKRLLNMETGQQINNYFIQAAVDLGLIGFSVAVLIFTQAAIMARKLWQSPAGMLAVGVLASLTVAFLNGLAEVTIFALPYTIIFWMLLGVSGNIHGSMKTLEHENTRT